MTALHYIGGGLGERGEERDKEADLARKRAYDSLINMTFIGFMITKCTLFHIMSEPEPAWQSERINMHRIGNPTQPKAGVPLHGRQFCGHGDDEPALDRRSILPSQRPILL